MEQIDIQVLCSFPCLLDGLVTTDYLFMTRKLWRVQLSHRITYWHASTQWCVQKAVHGLCTFCHGLLQLWKSFWPSNRLKSATVSTKWRIHIESYEWWIRKRAEKAGVRQTTQNSSVCLRLLKVFSLFYHLFASCWATGMHRVALLWPATSTNKHHFGFLLFSCLHSWESWTTLSASNIFV